MQKYDALLVRVSRNHRGIYGCEVYYGRFRCSGHVIVLLGAQSKRASVPRTTSSSASSYGDANFHVLMTTHTHTYTGRLLSVWILDARRSSSVKQHFRGFCPNAFCVAYIQHTHRRFAKYCNLPHTYTSDTYLYDTPQGIIIQRFMVYERTSCRQKQRRCGANYGAYIYRGSA